MKNVSNNYLEKMQSSLRTFVPRMTIDGVEISGEIQAGLSVTMGSCGTEKFAIGACFIPTMTASLTGCSTSVQDKEILLEMGLVLADGTIEYHKVGYFTVEKPQKDKFQTSFTAYGRLMSKAGGVYISELSYPAAISSVLDEIKTQTGLNIVLNGLTAGGTIATPIVGEVYREALMRIAGLLGGFVTENGDGDIVISKYELNKAVTVDTDFCYSYPETNDLPYEVTGIGVIVSEDSKDEDGNVVEGEKYYSADDANVIIQNPYMTAELFETCKSNIVGFSYMPAKVEFLGDIRLEPWDSIVLTDEDPDDGIDVPCMNITHVWDGGIVTTVTAPGQTATEDSSAFGGPLSKMVERTYQRVIFAEKVIASEVSTERLKAKMADIGYVTVDEIRGELADFGYVTVDEINGKLADFGYVTADEINAKVAELGYAKVDELEAKIADFGYVKTDELNAATADIEKLFAGYATITSLEAVNAKFGSLNATYATLDLANVKDGSINRAMIGSGVVGTAQIADGSITDAKIVELTANKITAGTLSVERLEIRGSTKSLVYSLNNISGALQAQNVNTLNGEVLTPRTITADKIVANAITANEIATKTITANEIAAGTITAAQIKSGTITATQIAAGTITANEIKSGTITATQIAAGTITANKLSVTSLSAISANMGTITAGSINIGNGNFVVTTGGVFTAKSGTVEGTIKASGGNIGGLNIGTSALQSANYKESSYTTGPGGVGSGTIVTGIKIDWNEGALRTPQIILKDNYISVTGYADIKGNLYAKTLTVNSAHGTYYASGYNSAVIGESWASGDCSFASGYWANAKGTYSTAMGYGTTAEGRAQTVVGSYNDVDGSKNCLFVVGNGDGGGDYSNAFTVDWRGNGQFAGSISANGQTMDDFIVDCGTTDGWYFEKWYSGKAVCWKEVTVNIESWAVWSNYTYEGTPTVQVTYPSGLFTSVPHAKVSARSAAGVESVETYGWGSKTTSPVYYAVRPSSVPKQDFTFLFDVIGRWK